MTTIVGGMTATPPKRRPYAHPSWTDQERLAFWTKVDQLSGCLIWQGEATPAGYGRLNYKGSTTYAHRWSWTIKHGPIAPGMVVCHRCDVPRCVNPDHLFLDSQAGNMADMKAKWRTRRRLGLSRFKSHGGIPPDAKAADIAPIRIILGEFELLGEAVLRPIASAVRLPTIARHPPSTISRKEPRSAVAPARAPTSRRRSSSGRGRPRTS
jgi:hypothetical protein